jgi:hypothetical protein
MMNKLMSVLYKKRSVLKDFHTATKSDFIRLFPDLYVAERLSVPGPGEDIRFEWETAIKSIDWTHRNLRWLREFWFMSANVCVDEEGNHFEPPVGVEARTYCHDQ